MVRERFERIEVPLAVAVGGATGSVLRWCIATVIDDDRFPVATLLTNLIGCFALGVVLVAGEVLGRHAGHHHRHQLLHVRLWRPFMATGVLGGFTTFSTFVVEMNHLSPLLAGIYLVASITLGLAAYAGGNHLARSTFGVRA